MITLHLVLYKPWMKIALFWDVPPCSGRERRFGRSCFTQLDVRKTLNVQIATSSGPLVPVYDTTSFRVK
jgi:hypothetical protein